MSEAADKAAYEAVQDANGIDVELLRANRKLTLEERYEQYRRAMASLHWLKLAREHSRPPASLKGAR